MNGSRNSKKSDNNDGQNDNFASHTDKEDDHNDNDDGQKDNDDGHKDNDDDHIGNFHHGDHDDNDETGLFCALDEVEGEDDDGKSESSISLHGQIASYDSSFVHEQANMHLADNNRRACLANRHNY